MALNFKERTKHGKLDFHPGVAYDFEDPNAVAYFKAAGWADDAPAGATNTVRIAKDELDIDPNTVFATGPNRGQKVLGGGKAGSGSVKPDTGTIGG